MSDEVKLVPVEAMERLDYDGEVWVRGKLDFAVDGALVVVVEETANGPIQLIVQPEEVRVNPEAAGRAV